MSTLGPHLRPPLWSGTLLDATMLLESEMCFVDASGLSIFALLAAIFSYCCPHRNGFVATTDGNDRNDASADGGTLLLPRKHLPLPLYATIVGSHWIKDLVSEAHAVVAAESVQTTPASDRELRTALLLVSPQQGV